MRSYFKQLLVPTFMCLGLPLAGIIAAGRDPGPYLLFPPRPVRIEHPGFSPVAFILILVFVAGCLLPFVLKGLAFKKTKGPIQSRLPWWGVLSVIGLAGFWGIAWTRFPIFESFQAHTFFPLWLCLIISINAVIYGKTDSCPLTDNPARFCLLFIFSAFFWWTFEYLNRFVGNWYYTGADYPAGTYFLLATLSFSTVLPAVESVKAYLLTFKLFSDAFKTFKPCPWINHRGLAAGSIILSGITLFLTAAFPVFLFPAVWICPFLILLGWRIVIRQDHLFSGLKKGDLTMVVAHSCAALICGFFWEMFNMYSLARWEYSIPFVDVLHIFEMPLLGYAGYLPFGLECAVIIDIVQDQPSCKTNRAEQ